MWSSVASTRHVNCGLPPEFFFVAPASSFQHHHPDAAAAAAAAATTTTVNFDTHPFNASSAIGVGVGVIPLLTATPYLAQQNIGSGGSVDDDVLNIARSRSSGGMHLWQHQQSQNSSGFSSKKPMILDHTSLLQSGTGGSTACGIGGSSSMGATTCQDCGNQAKKDCVHGRCRTCCKSRGYECVTHVRSTWVSASRRRERQIARENIPAAGSSQSTSGTKKPRLGGTSQTTTTASHTSTSNTTPPRSFDTSSSHQDASFKDSLPSQVRAPAVFKCVRVTALDDGEDEYAYQAIVKIGGHVFKGFLYDQGIEGRDGSFPSISELHLGGGGGNIAGRGGGASSTPLVLHPPDILAAPGGGFLEGTSYGNPMN
ncbi:protein LATERAL ROOT PRIMORDIUM 1-like isoform X2 [Primulina huaijiensis]|uniref:protein LATERAL ROOT PRIMORDIUM 1-like isoform X2 n=1 Tax=Primulina huaijiensis TaxID=1492673 RepID=UPI003CC75739